MVVVPTSTGPRFGFAPPTTIDPKTLVFSPYSPGAPLKYFTAAVPPGPSGFEGNDPVLGPPFAPIGYQLNVAPLSPQDFPSAGGCPACNCSGNVCATLYWTVPDLNNFAYNLATIDLSTDTFSVWTSNTQNAASATKAGDWSSLPSQLSIFIPTSNYIWFTSPSGTRPVNPGAAIPGGTSYKGRVRLAGGLDPGTITAAPAWSAFPPDSISYFTLERNIDGQKDGSGNLIWTMLQSHITVTGSPPYFAPDSQGRLITSNYFYRMFGYTANGLKFPYNTVGLIHPYDLTITPGTKNPDGSYTGTKIQWVNPPDATSWPTDHP